MKKENIILVGAGQHCRVVIYNLFEQKKYYPIGILDSNDEKIGQKICGISVIGNYNDLSFLSKVKDEYQTNKFFISFGNMKYRKECYEYFIDNGWDAVNIIHPNAVISQDAEIGNGVLIECGCLITPNPKIGNNVVVNTGSQVNHDNYIGDHVYIASGVVLSGGVTIEENTLLDDGVIVSLGKKVGRNCIIGAGAVVTKDISDNRVAYGNPCKEIRENK